MNYDLIRSVTFGRFASRGLRDRDLYISFNVPVLRGLVLVGLCVCVY